MSVSASAISRVTGVAVQYKNFNAGAAQMLSQRLAVFGTGNHDTEYSTEKYECQGSAAEIGERYGYGSPLHLAARQLFPVMGSGASFPVTFYPQAEAEDAIQAAGAIGCTGAATESGSGTVSIGGVDADFAITSGENAAAVLAKIKDAIDGVLYMPVTAGSVADGSLPLTSKAAGTVGNLIKINVDCDVDGLVFTTTAMANGAIDPDISDSLNEIGDVWETAILSCYKYDVTTLLDKYLTFGKDRWSDLNKKPLIVFHGCTDDYATRTAITDARPTDYINALVVSVGSTELPYVIAAKAMVNDILTTADSNPAQGYKGLLEGLKAGSDGEQETYSVRNQSVKKGSSTNIKNGSVAELNDIVTMYHPTAEGNMPSRRYVVDLIKLENVVYNVRLIMESDELKGAPLVEDNTVTSNKAAVQPKTIKTMFLNLARSLADKAIIQDTDFTKENMEVAIDSSNPKRLNVSFPVKLSGNVEVTSTDVYFGFYLGGN